MWKPGENPGFLHFYITKIVACMVMVRKIKKAWYNRQKGKYEDKMIFNKLTEKFLLTLRIRILDTLQFGSILATILSIYKKAFFMYSYYRRPLSFIEIKNFFKVSEANQNRRLKMLIHAVEGLATGKCGKSVTFDTCRSTMFSFVKQNPGLRALKMLPLTGGRAEQLLPKKVKRIVLKHFPIKGLMILTRIKIKN